MKPLDDAIVNILTELIEKYQVYKTGDLNSHRMRDAWIKVSFFLVYLISQIIVQDKRQSTYVSATISLVMMHYHNISGKACLQTEHYKRFSCNALLEFLL